jgi:DNA-binding XRE family transcriptional regulator
MFTQRFAPLARSSRNPPLARASRRLVDRLITSSWRTPNATARHRGQQHRLILLVYRKRIGALQMRLLSVDYSRIRRDSLRMSGARNPVLVESFANIVREARQATGITQEQLAHDADIDRTYIGLLENGHRQPSLSVIFAIAQSLGLTPELLVRRTRERAVRLGETQRG